MSSLPSGEQESIQRCWYLAATLIDDVHETWDRPTQCQMAAWYATWQLYQAAMIPILLLYCEQDYTTHVDACTKQIETALETLVSLERWCPTGKRTLEVITRLYDASKSYARVHRVRQSLLDAGPNESQSGSDLTSNTAGGSPSADGLVNVIYPGLDDLAIDLSGFAPTEYDNDLSFLDF